MRNVGFNKLLPIAVYAGLCKPNFSGFIEQLHIELVLFKSYVNVSGFFINITNVLFICDVPARSFCQCVKNHSGYNACPYCRIPGVYTTNKVIFPILLHILLVLTVIINHYLNRTNYFYLH